MATQDHQSDAKSPQPSCMLLQLPGEIRNLIYSWVFSSSRLAFGVHLKPARNTLSILYVCRQINQEAKTLWLGQILFSFDDPYLLLEKLSALPPPATLSQIRHLRVDDFFGLTIGPDELDSRGYDITSCLKLLPNLRLDTLTICGSIHSPLDGISRIIQYGNGWKELYYRTANTLQAWNEEIDDYEYRPWSSMQNQPRRWQRMLRRRDGADSGATVTVYRSIEPDTCGAVMDPQKRQVFTGAEERLAGTSTSRYERLIEHVVVVKRGRNANIEEPPEPSGDFKDDIRSVLPGKTWEELRDSHLHMIEVRNHRSQRFEIDTYDRVDQCNWCFFKRKMLRRCGKVEKCFLIEQCTPSGCSISHLSCSPRKVALPHNAWSLRLKRGVRTSLMLVMPF